ncbi:MAG: type I-B CRISPR-associated protein Cas7/Cst2/DevR [Calditrichia bacterium]
MFNNAIGFVLIDAPHSALNNAGQDAGARTENAVVVKTIRKGREVYPYVSGQAWRYWWRNILAEKFKWQLSPIIRETKIAFTAANPFLYPDDDIFGYMRALKKNEGGTLTRLSPLKCSPLVSVYPQLPTDDFGVMARQEGDPVPFEHQFYSTTFKGIFSLDLERLGKFDEQAKTGFKNLDKAYVEKDDIQNAIKESGATIVNGKYQLPKETRISRAQDAIKALNYIYSTTKSASHLTDVTPKLVILAVIEGGNHIFMNITNSDYHKPLINIEALKQVIQDYKNIIKSKVYIGRQDGFLDELKDRFQELKSEIGDEMIELCSPKTAIDNFADELKNYIE